MDQFAWMAWTWQTAVFFILLGALLTVMTLLALYRPQPERIGIFRIQTTRGDRLFISLLAAAFIHLVWLGLFGADLLPAAAVLSLAMGAAVFRWA